LPTSQLGDLTHTNDFGINVARQGEARIEALSAAREEERLTIRVSTQEGKTLTVVRIEGHFTNDDVPDVRAACESAKPPLRLDLSGLRSADADGIHLLRSLSETGAELLGANPYIRQLLLETET
jgi:anti-anti-sigma regulatory factor